MAEKMTIRYGRAEDAAVLAELGERTFRETYYTDAHLEQKYIDAYIAATFNLKEARTDLLNEKIIFLLAEVGEKVIGYARLRLESRRPEVAARRPLEISRIYLTKEFWGHGLGQILLQRCVEEAENKDCDGVWLSVWEHNPRAIAFYKKHGLQTVGTHIFDLASSPQTDYIMSKSLKGKNPKSKI